MLLVEVNANLEASRIQVALELFGKSLWIQHDQTQTNYHRRLFRVWDQTKAAEAIITRFMRGSTVCGVEGEGKYQG